jgi:hypothetical protein
MISVQRNHVLELCEFDHAQSRIEAESAGRQIVWKETAPSHLKKGLKFVRTRIRLRNHGVRRSTSPDFTWRVKCASNPEVRWWAEPRSGWPCFERERDTTSPNKAQS